MRPSRYITTSGLALLCLALASCAQTDSDLTSNTGIAQTEISKSGFSSESVFGDGGEGSADIGRREVIKNPTVAQLMAPDGPNSLEDRFIGAANAPVTMIEFASLTCPHCRAFHETVYPQFKREFIDTGKVRLILREFPIGRSSGTAWLITRCTTGEQYFELYGKYLKEQRLWVSQEVRTEEIFKIAASTGMTRDQFNACLANKQLIAQLKQRKERARTLGIIGTPTFYIRDKMVRSVPTMEQLRAIINPMLENPRAPSKTG